MTIKELYDELGELIEAGKGDYELVKVSPEYETGCCDYVKTEDELSLAALL